MEPHSFSIEMALHRHVLIIASVSVLGYWGFLVTDLAATPTATQTGEAGYSPAPVKWHT